jgi:SAM-dependent methyltransferase
MNENWDEIWSHLGEGMGNNPARKVSQDAILRRISSGKILDYGAGDGELVIRMAERGLNAIGSEMSIQGMDLGNLKSSSKGLGQLLFSPENPTVSEAKFNVIVLSEILEHLEEPSLLLESLATNLETGGKVIITVPAGPISYFDRFIGHHRHYSKKSLTKDVQRANYEVLELKQIGFPIINLVRIWCLLRGKKIITELSNPNRFVNSKIFRWLFDILSLTGQFNSILGWQLIAVIRPK